MMSADTAMLDDLRPLEDRLDRLELEFRSVLDKYVPISEQRINKLWTAVRGTINEFSSQVLDEHEQRKLQNEKITTLSNEVQQLKQQVIMMSVQLQGGMKVPDGSPD